MEAFLRRMEQSDDVTRRIKLISGFSPPLLECLQAGVAFIDQCVQRSVDGLDETGLDESVLRMIVRVVADATVCGAMGDRVAKLQEASARWSEHATRILSKLGPSSVARITPAEFDAFNVLPVSVAKDKQEDNQRAAAPNSSDRAAEDEHQATAIELSLGPTSKGLAVFSGGLLGVRETTSCDPARLTRAATGSIGAFQGCDSNLHSGSIPTDSVGGCLRAIVSPRVLFDAAFRVYAEPGELIDRMVKMQAEKEGRSGALKACMPITCFEDMQVIPAIIAPDVSDIASLALVLGSTSNSVAARGLVASMRRNELDDTSLSVARSRWADEVSRRCKVLFNKSACTASAQVLRSAACVALSVPGANTNSSSSSLVIDGTQTTAAESSMRTSARRLLDAVTTEQHGLGFNGLSADASRTAMQALMCAASALVRINSRGSMQ